MTDRSVNILIKARDQASSVFSKITKSGDAMLRTMTSLRGIVATGIGFAGLSIGVKRSVEAFGQQQEAEESVRKALKRLGGDVEGNLNILKRYSAQLQSVSTLGDESALAIQAIALQAGASIPMAQKLTTAAVDLGGALGKDANEAARQLVKTLGGFGGELGELVPEIKALTKEQLQAGAAIDLIAQKFKGAGDAAGSYQRRYRQLMNSIGDLSEKTVETVVSAFNGQNQSIEQYLVGLRTAVDETTNLLDLWKQANEERARTGDTSVSDAGAVASWMTGRTQTAAIGNFIGEQFAGLLQPAFDAQIRQIGERASQRRRQDASAQADDELLSGLGRVNMGFQRSNFARNFLPGVNPSDATAQQIAQAQGGALAQMAQQFAAASKSLLMSGQDRLQAAIGGAMESGRKAAADATAKTLAGADMKAMELRAQYGDDEARKSLELLRIREQFAEVEKELLTIANARYASEEARAEAEERLNSLYGARAKAEASLNGDAGGTSSAMRRVLAPLVEGLGLVGLGASYRQNGPAQKAQKAAEDTAKHTEKTAKTLDDIARRLNTGRELAIGVIG